MNRIVKETRLPGGRTLKIVQGDLTEERVDAIVNAANAHLAHGGGVAGAIVSRGGRQIQAESDAWVRANGLASHNRPGITSGGSLPCRYVIHAVGPVWGTGEEDAKLAAAVRSAIQAAGALGLESLAMPAISTGIFGYPMPRAARVILRAVRDELAANPASSLNDVRLVLYDAEAVEIFVEALQDDHIFPESKD